MSVRVRFAPSPTGPLHIGGVRTALYNFLFAKKNKGKFILRIEDTDQNRFVDGALEYIMNSLEWLGIRPDEGIREGGDFGPYRQFQRKNIYQKFADQLIESGNAYYAFDTAQELEAMRARLKEAKSDTQLYNYLTRSEMKNSLSLDKEETRNLMASESERVIRLKVPENTSISFTDLIRGNVEFNSSNIDDKVLLKSDGMPTYHLANVVDDHLMKISHVIRGEEWLSSTPIHVLLYQGFDWKSTMPKFAHLPLLLKPDGNGKLSKRDADKQGFPIFPISWKDSNTGEVSEGFREKGFLPEALINFLAFLGWNPGTEKEIYALAELCEDFSVERIQKGGSKFDFEKAIWFNQQYVHKLPKEKMISSLKISLEENQIKYSDEKVSEAVELMKDRVSFLHELFTEARYLWEAPSHYEENVVARKWNADTKKAIQSLMNTWHSLDLFTASNIKESLESTLVTIEMPAGKVMQALRHSITGKGGGPDLIGIIAFLGKDESLKRMRTTFNSIN